MTSEDLKDHDIFGCKCSYTQCGLCKLKVKNCAVDDHREICTEEIIPCFIPGCTEKFLRKDMSLHLLSCSGYSIICKAKHLDPNSFGYCLTEFLRGTFLSHYTTCHPSITSNLIPCPMKGCSELIKKEALGNHFMECPYNKVICRSFRNNSICLELPSFKDLKDHFYCNHMADEGDVQLFAVGPYRNYQKMPIPKPSATEYFTKIPQDILRFLLDRLDCGSITSLAITCKPIFSRLSENYKSQLILFRQLKWKTCGLCQKTLIFNDTEHFQHCEKYFIRCFECHSEVHISCFVEHRASHDSSFRIFLKPYQNFVRNEFQF